jgi:hypothetical protein
MTDAAAPLEPGDQLVAPSSTPRKRRTALAAAGVVGVAAVIGGGVWVGQAFLARGPQPAEALPASTLGYAAVDLDPSGSQKLEAADFLGAFPSLNKGKSSGDLRERFFNLAMSDLTCDLDFKDVEPWVGNRAAIAVVGYDKPEFVTVLEVTDGPGLEKGLDKTEKCGSGTRGHAVLGNWAVLARTDAVAKAVLADGAEAPLSQDTDFQKWTDKAGDAGIVTLYAAPAVGDAILKAAEKQPFIAMMAASGFGSLDPIGMGAGLVPLYGLGVGMSPEMAAEEESGSYEGFSQAPLTKAEERRLEKMTPAEQGAFFQERYAPVPTEVMSKDEMDALPPEVREQMLQDDQASLAADAADDLADEGMPTTADEVMSEEDMATMEDDFPMPEVPEEVRSALRSFRGAGGVVRFADGALEFELVADHLGTGANNLAAGGGGDDLLDTFADTTPIAYGAGLADGWESYLFDAFSMGMWGSSETSMIREFENGTGLDYPADLEALGGEGFAVVADEGFDPEEVFFEGAPGIAARIHGDAAKVEAALAKLKRNAAASLVWRRDGDDVLVGADKAFLDRLAGASGLSGSKTYQAVLPDASDAASVLFIDFDAHDWLVKTSSEKDRADTEPFDALGFSRTVKDDEDRTLVRLTTD